MLKNNLSKEFEIKDLGPVRRILGIDITRNDSEKEIYLIQESYLKKVLQIYNKILSNEAYVPLSPGIELSDMQSPTSQKEMINMSIVAYASAIGSLMYNMVCCKLDLAYSVSMINIFMSNPGRSHWEVVKEVLRYVKGSLSYGLKFKSFPETHQPLLGYVDAEYSYQEINHMFCVHTFWYNYNLEIKSTICGSSAHN